jgi:hypothetical protein
MDNSERSHRRLRQLAAVAMATVLCAGVGSLGAVAAEHATASTALADELEAQIQAILDGSLRPGAIDWNCCGVDLPPTGVIVGVRVPAAGRTSFSPRARTSTTERHSSRRPRSPPPTSGTASSPRSG